MKIVINTDFGGFGLSEAAVMRYAELAGVVIVGQKHESFDLMHYYVNAVHDDNYWIERELERDNPQLVQVVEELGEAASDRYASLKVVEIPDGVSWHIAEYDGHEWVAEDHRTWK